MLDSGFLCVRGLLAKMYCPKVGLIYTCSSHDQYKTLMIISIAGKHNLRILLVAGLGTIEP